MDNEFRIINCLGKNWGKMMSMNELSKIAKMPYATFHRTAKKMNDLIIIEEIGKSKILKINEKNPIIVPYLEVSSEKEKKEFLEKKPIIKKIALELETEEAVLLFGSYAKGAEKESSDIDLMIINETGKKTANFSKYEILFKKKINPLFIAQKEFIQMINEKEENVGKQTLKNHVVLKNPQNFWRLIIK
ncbi:MAG: nucleotidyltransferase domain-containing protein [Candidatus Nanoarchaeia archaeon]|nr:nucleotidyltransferase domain-containing protein [Candidatus Nanoarchaeia archaeon]MDD5054359.1 nucleotidyltransferase domain-containing protein [Candidatus Nanoarchaeia archaeon]MDD5499705.1 nucleotidyltransferase domain-containing protein [Candidatus Nanoarchaeia archaeon]